MNSILLAGKIHEIDGKMGVNNIFACTFTLIVNLGDEEKSRNKFYNIYLSGHQAERAYENFTEGSWVCLHGRLSSKEYRSEKDNSLQTAINVYTEKIYPSAEGVNMNKARLVGKVKNEIGRFKTATKFTVEIDTYLPYSSTIKYDSIPVTVFEADEVYEARKLKKGDLVTVDGSFEISSYVSKEGVSRKSYGVNALSEAIVPLGSYPSKKETVQEQLTEEKEKTLTKSKEVEEKSTSTTEKKETAAETSKSNVEANNQETKGEDKKVTPSKRVKKELDF